MMRSTTLVLLLCCTAFGTQATAETAGPASVLVTAPLPIEQFFSHASLSGALLSPDGRLLAMRVAPAEGRDRLSVLDLTSMRTQVVAAFTDVDIGDFLWVNEKRLAFRLTDRQNARKASSDGAGMYAVNSDGSVFRQLVTRWSADNADKPLRPWEREGQENPETLADGPQTKNGRTLLPQNTVLMDSIGEQRSNAIYALRPESDEFGAVRAASLIRLDTIHGSNGEIASPKDVRYWLYDRGGQARIATAQTRGQNLVYWRDPATEKWQLLAQFDPRSNDATVFEPAFLTPEGDFYVTARKGGDKAALYRFDLEKKQLDAQPIVSSADYDIRATMVRSSTRLLGIRYSTDTETTVWLDADMQAIQKTVNAQLPATVNTLSVGERSSTPFVLVSSWSDTQPVIYRIFNRDTGKLVPLAKSRPAVNEAKMATRQLQHYTARDGLRIPAWLSLPRNGPRKQLPMVVVVHDGPWQRSDWGWNGETQFLASRGYAVLEPDYRGTIGLGETHFRTSWKQWGGTMQDDIADGVRWAIAEGVADPRRICIAGGGYGGYAALMGLAKDGDLYRCGVAWSAVPDVAEVADGRWRVGGNLDERYDRYPASTLIGDARSDAAQWRASSPRYQAARITQSLLLAHGDADPLVSSFQANRLYQAIREGNAQAQWLRYDDEGHDLRVPKNRIDFWSRVEKFLDANIGNARTSTQVE
ncbi:prolyl oligopeptidase family serine peptidase [Janthinobacterium sp. Mn2066]|uniref:S9 family peptidase n=1 Tax=Janthinobacterium sp. Mn2066 TaxID=3395264 RepID=UPI003BE1D279